MPLDQGSERGLTGLAFVVQEPLEQVAIGQPDGGPRGEQELDLLEQRSRRGSIVHESVSSALDDGHAK